MPDQYVARVVDLTDPAAQRIPNMSIEEARERVASGDPGARARDRRLVFHRRPRRTARAPGPVARSSVALLPRQGSRRPGAHRLGPDRRHPRLPREGGPRRTVPSELHAHGARPLRRGARARRMPGPLPDVRALLHAGARRVLPRSPRRSDRAYVGALRGRDRDVARGGSRARADRRLAFPAASTAAPCSWSPTTSCAGGAWTSGASRRSPSRSAAARTSRRRATFLESRSGSDCFLEPIEVDAGALDPLEAVRRRRGLQAARRRVGDDGARALPRHSRALPATGASCSTATAATRT